LKISQIVVTVWYYSVLSHSFSVCELSGLSAQFHSALGNHDLFPNVFRCRL